mmetsp:Transcript_37507/g.55857  ORF Transcript_37507/g.55857 Transcript_37507/m.55857 type:complete len:92 (-) Transcript_37507:66-341(-)
MWQSVWVNLERDRVLRMSLWIANLDDCWRSGRHRSPNVPFSTGDPYVPYMNWECDVTSGVALLVTKDQRCKFNKARLDMVQTAVEIGDKST